MNYYFHLPFCRNKCGYCAFYSEAAPEKQQIVRYLDALDRELGSREWEPAETVYFGGGTPTLLESSELRRLFGMVKSALRPSDGCEISIEANPETLDAGKTAAVRDFATRISLGIQSFSPGLRGRLGRDCSQTALERALSLICDAGFDHFNLDLIYAIPGQTLCDWRRDLEFAAASGADHVSCYSLTPEEGSRLGGSFAVDEDAACEMYDAAGDVLASYGILRYEISNYARRGTECRHNTAVWRGGRLKGFGPSAAGFDGTDRQINAGTLDEWLAGAPPQTDCIPPESRLNEIFAVNLRTVAGWTAGEWEAVPHADSWQTRIAGVRMQVAGLPPEWFSSTPGRFALSGKGLLFWDTVAQTIL